METIESFIVEGAVKHSDVWQMVRLANEDGQTLNPAKSLEQAKNTLTELNEALNSSQIKGKHLWTSLRIVKEVRTREVLVASNIK